MSDYKQFCGIARNDQGIIERTGERTFLGKRGIPGVLNATAEYRVVRVEPGDVAGWGDAIAIGNVELLIDGRANGFPFLALLYP